MTNPHDILDFLLQEVQTPALFLRAQPHPALTAGQWSCYQPFKPLADKLLALGLSTSTHLGEVPTAPHMALMGSRQKEENRILLAHAARHLPDGGTLSAILPNDLGAKTLENDIKALFGQAVSASKHHARRITTTRTNQTDLKLAAEWAALATAGDHGSGFITAPGMFSWRKVDAGSALLAKHLPTNLSGKLADLCAGWGYLTFEALKNNPAISSADLYEAEHLALDCARLNLNGAAIPVAYHWADVTALPAKRQYDVIVCNPPVHDLHDGDVELGQRVVMQALAMGNPRSRIYIVANRRLPYEALLNQKCRRVTVLAEENGYKVLEAHL
ncbi:MAG: methyltransferase [Proteobacteria bacterium]|nr:methyltransferase [Pseudomonadota bacterium]